MYYEWISKKGFLRSSQAYGLSRGLTSKKWDKKRLSSAEHALDSKNPDLGLFLIICKILIGEMSE